MLHEGWPVEDQRECSPLFYADLVDRELIQELQRAWLRLEEKTHAGGRKLLLHGRQDRSDRLLHCIVGHSPITNERAGVFWYPANR
jgi:hypothetical protein